jgi:hypothetical protein
MSMPMPSRAARRQTDVNIAGSSVPEIRAIGVKYYPCVSKNGLQAKPTERLVLYMREES